MENIVIFPPNKAFDRIVGFSKSPVIYKNLMFIDFNEKGQSILGCSNFGTIWEGTLLFFNSDNNLLTLNYDKSYISATVCDGKFLNNDTVILAENSGTLNVVTTAKEGQYLESVNYFRHIDPIKQLAIWGCNSNVLTCSGNNVTIWDVNSKSRQPIQQYVDIHTETVNSVDTIKSEQHVFLSASTDRKCCIWDYRLPIPASVLYNNEFCALTSVVSYQKDPNYLIVGNEGGDIYLLDKREPKEFLSKFNVDYNIHRISNNSNLFAFCGDSNQIQVLRFEDELLHQIYVNNEHKGITRGLSWFNNVLYSCAFDKKVLKHLL